MHPSFGIEYLCPSFEWGDLMKGPSREAVLAHTYKVLNYRTLFGPRGPGRAEIGTARRQDEPAAALALAADRSATAA